MRRVLLVALIFAGACSSPTLSPGDVVTLTVTTNVPAGGVFVGDQVQINAFANYVSGEPAPVSLSYTSNNLTVASVNSSGLITALAAGTATITVSSTGKSVNLVLVVDGNVSHNIIITPSVATIAVGSQVPFTFTVLTTLGNPARGKSVNWSSSDTTDAPVDSTGTVTGLVANPNVSICATATDAPAVKGCAAVAVVVPVEARLRR